MKKNKKGFLFYETTYRQENEKGKKESLSCKVKARPRMTTAHTSVPAITTQTIPMTICQMGLFSGTQKKLWLVTLPWKATMND